MAPSLPRAPSTLQSSPCQLTTVPLFTDSIWRGVEPMEAALSYLVCGVTGRISWEEGGSTHFDTKTVSILPGLFCLTNSQSSDVS